MLIASSLTWAAGTTPAGATLPPTPSLRLVRTLQTTPFPGSTLGMSDHEGSAYVARDNSLWLADDDGRAIFEVNPATGALKRKIRGSEFAAVTELGGGERAGTTRADDIQALAYDARKDILLVFSGNCCAADLKPTAFRLTRTSGTLQLDSYRPLGDVKVSAAGWNPGDGTVYLGADSTLRTYSYASNTLGGTFGVPGVSGIYGLDFTDDGRDLFIARPPSTVTRVDWGARTVVPGWDLDLSPYGILDARGVQVIAEQLWVSDGFDFRPATDPLDHALFVFDVGGSAAGDPTPPPPPPGGTPTPPATSGKNLIGNPGFEKTLRGWRPSPRAGTKLARVHQGHRGSWSVRVTRTAGRGTIGLADSRDWVSKSRAGTYTASVWVRAIGPGSTLKLKLREVRNGKTLSASAERVRLTRSWKQVTTSLATRSPGRSSIDFAATVKRATKKVSFGADDASLTLSPR